MSVPEVMKWTGEWEKVEVTVDSGASEWIGPESVAKHLAIEPTAASKAGAWYEAANGTRIFNKGQKRLTGVGTDGTALSVTMQVGDVTRVLGAVSRMTQAGNRVVFDNDGSYVQNKQTGHRTEIELRNGEYKLDMWIPKAADFKGGGIEAVNGPNSTTTTPGTTFTRPEQLV